MTELEAQAKDFAISHKMNLSEPTVIAHTIELMEEAYIAGAKGNGVVWHDLRKDPKDLPKDEEEVLVCMWDSYYIGYYSQDTEEEKRWHFENFSEGTEQADAWCEIPQFKE